MLHDLAGKPFVRCAETVENRSLPKKDDLMSLPTTLAGTPSEQSTTLVNAGSGVNPRRSFAATLAVWFVALAALASSVSAQQASAGVPVTRVLKRVANDDVTVLYGQTPPAIAGATDLGRLSQQTAMSHLIMVLRPTAEQDHALRTLLDQQLDQRSANYHHWLKPEEFGAHFGVTDSDIAAVTDWLTQQGMTVEQVAPSKQFIQFSGTVGQVESAFRTQMHSFSIKGTTYVSNNSDISVPSALKLVIAGVPTLNNFFKKSDFQGAHTLADTRAASRPSSHWTPEPDGTNDVPGVSGKFYFLDYLQGAPSFPDYTSGATHFVGAGDFAAIYNTTPLLGAGNDGTGVSIGVVGRTDIHLSDVQLYRFMFSLKVNDPTFVVVGEDPGVVGGDDGESYLDVEVSGGAAPGANVKFITSRATLTTDGVDLSAMYAVQNNLTDIITESYGQCEANFSAAAISFYADLWGQAAAQGQSVFVSSGDNGPAGCDSSSSTTSSFRYAVSGLASTPFNVAVGGTLFADTAANWNATATTAPPFASALGYIPEIPWNEAKASGAVGAAQLWSGSGGISAYITTPPWQRGFGVPLADPAYPDAANIGSPVSTPTSPFVPGPHRYMPDVAMAAAAQHDGTLYCAEGICQLSNTGSLINAGIVGGTSVAAPTMAGVQALIDQYNGGRQGMPNYVYYALADAQHTAGLNCAANAGAALDANCAFRDITTGNTLICTDSLSGSTCTVAKKIGWTAVAGYDMATGLGSPNATQLAHLWNTITFRSTTTTMVPSQTTGITHGQSVTITGTVAPGAGSGVPTGQVTFLPTNGDPMNPSNGAMLNPAPLATLDGSGNYSILLSNIPAGTYFLTARYGGDGTFAASISIPVQVTVGQENSTVTIAPNAFNGTTCVETPATTFNYGDYVWTDLTVAGLSGQGVPTGTVAITDNGNPLTTTSLNAAGLGHTLSGAIPNTSCVLGYTFQDTAPLVAGTHVLGASYSGDTSFNSASASTVTVTINPATATGALTSSSPFISSGGSVQLTFTVNGLSGAGPGTLTPTGTVTFTDTTTSTTLGTATLSPTVTLGGRAILTTTGISTAGANSITASWPGDANYNGITSTPVTVTVQGGTATSVAVTSNTNPATLGGRPIWTATMTPTTVTSGTVTFYDGGVSLGTGTVGAAHTATFRPAAAVNLPVGVHSITAIYGGNATFNSSTSPVFPQTFNQAATTVNLTVRTGGTWGQLFELSAELGTTQAATPASGTIQFLDGGTPIGAPQIFATVPSGSGGFGLFEADKGFVLPAGTHVLTAQLTDPNYTAPVSAAQTVTVSQATPVMTALGGTFTYNGAPHGGSGSATGGAGETLSVTLSYTGTGATTYGPSATAPTGAGTYTVTTHTAGDTNNAATDSAPAALTINKANATVSGTGGTFTYNGSPQSGSGSATGGAGESLSVTLSYTGTGTTTYGPSSTAPTGAGTYQVVATTTGDSNNNGGSSSPQSLTINKANAAVNATGGTFTYNGSAQAGSGSATGGAGETLTVTLSYSGTGATTYGPSATAPSLAGTYQVTATTAGDANNNGGTSSPSALTINKFNTLMAAFGGTFTYNGSPEVGSGQALGGAGESLPVTLSYQGISGTTYGPTATAPTNAGVYLVTAHTVGDANNNAEDSLPNALRINKATATIGVTGYCAVFDGLSHTAPATATGVLSESLTGLIVIGTMHTAAGTYLGDAWSFTNANYSDASGTVDDAIVSAVITAPGAVLDGSSNNASVVDAGAGATYTWGITGGTITAGAGTRSITFHAGTGSTVALNVTVTTTTSCSNSTSANVALTHFDVNGDNTIDPSDIFYLVNYLFMNGPAPAGAAGMLSGDANGDGVVDPADIFYVVNYLFKAGPHPQSLPTPGVVSTAAGSPAASRIAGTVTLGEGFVRDGKYVVPVIVTSAPDSMTPEALSLKVHFATDGMLASTTIHRAGAAKDLGTSFEVSRQTAVEDLSYLVSFDPASSLTLDSRRSAVIAEIEIDAPGRGAIAVTLDPRVTLLSDREGTREATVANGGLQLSGTTVDRGSRPTPANAGHEVN